MLYTGPTAWAIERARQERCRQEHAHKSYGVWIFGSDTAIGQLVKRNGQVSWRGRCRSCGYESGDIANDVIKRWAADRHITCEWTRHNTPGDYDICEVKDCDQPGVHQHHYAPRNVFGWHEADRWYIGPLCQEHHTFWHATMDEYVRCAKGIDV